VPVGQDAVHVDVPIICRYYYASP